MSADSRHAARLPWSDQEQAEGGIKQAGLSHRHHEYQSPTVPPLPPLDQMYGTCPALYMHSKLAYTLSERDLKIIN